MISLKLGVDFFSTLLTLFIVHHFFVCLGKHLVVSKKTAYSIYGVVLILMTSTSPMEHRYLVLPIVFTGAIAVISLLFSGKKYVNLFCGVLAVALVILAEMIIAGAMVLVMEDRYWADIQSELTYYTLGVLVSKLFAFLLLKVLGYKKIDAYKNVSVRAFLGLLLIPLSSIVILYGIGMSIPYYQSLVIMGVFVGISIMVCLSNLLVFYLFENQVKNSQMQARLTFAQQQIGYYKDISARQIEIRKLSHDMKHYLTGIWGFLKENQYSEAVSSLEQISTKLQNALGGYDTGHSAIDAILHIKKRQMDDLNIQFDSSVILPERLTLDALDLCVVLGNGLDNAIEACERIEDVQRRFIWLNMHMRSQYISICIENAIAQSGIPATFPQTSKQDPLNHGFGLESIRTIADKYDGDVNMSHADDVFQLAVLLKNG